MPSLFFVLFAKVFHTASVQYIIIFHFYDSKKRTFWILQQARKNNFNFAQGLFTLDLLYSLDTVLPLDTLRLLMYYILEIEP